MEGKKLVDMEMEGSLCFPPTGAKKNLMLFCGVPSPFILPIGETKLVVSSGKKCDDTILFCIGANSTNENALSTVSFPFSAYYTNPFSLALCMEMVVTYLYRAQL